MKARAVPPARRRRSADGEVVRRSRRICAGPDHPAILIPFGQRTLQVMQEAQVQIAPHAALRLEAELGERMIWLGRMSIRETTGQPAEHCALVAGAQVLAAQALDAGDEVPAASCARSPFWYSWSAVPPRCRRAGRKSRNYSRMAGSVQEKVEAPPRAAPR
jgi:hypothetical protein